MYIFTRKYSRLYDGKLMTGWFSFLSTSLTKERKSLYLRHRIRTKYVHVKLKNSDLIAEMLSNPRMKRRSQTGIMERIFLPPRLIFDFCKFNLRNSVEIFHIHFCQTSVILGHIFIGDSSYRNFSVLCTQTYKLISINIKINCKLLL
jgi:hypothetical protein